MVLVKGNKFAAMLAVGVVTALCAGAPARADDDSVFGQPAPKQFLLNKMFSPKNLGLDQSSGGANGQTAANGQAAGAHGQVAGADGQAAGANGQVAGANGQVAGSAPQEEDEDGNGAFPKRYLLNKMFDSGK